jgi:3-oxoadipate enol-lactonase
MIRNIQWMLFSALIGTLGCSTSFAQTSAGNKVDVGFAAVPGGKIYYESCGSSANNIVLIHDGVVDSAVWDGVWNLFCAKYRIVRYDRRGYGKSPVTTEPYFEADDLASILRTLEIGHTTIVASSHGGEIAMNFALRYPDTVSELVLVGPGASGFPYSAHFLGRDWQNTKSANVDQMIAAFARDPYLVLPGHEEARKQLAKLLASSPQDLTHDDLALPEKPVLPRIGQLQMPVLLLVGSGDIPDVQAIAGALVVEIPQAVRIVIPNSGHLMYLENPSEFLKLVDAFLALHPAQESR